MARISPTPSIRGPANSRRRRHRGDLGSLALPINSVRVRALSKRLGRTPCISGMHRHALNHFRVVTLENGQRLVKLYRTRCYKCPWPIYYPLAFFGRAPFFVCELFGNSIMGAIGGDLPGDQPKTCQRQERPTCQYNVAKEPFNELRASGRYHENAHFR